jgi:putative FmdB family regulatory protein
MPIYEYECENKHRFEKWQSMKDEPIKECPECGTSVRKILHPAGIIFKGSGWYITDSRKSSEDDSKAKPTKTETKAGDADTKTKAKSDIAGETKSAAKPDSTASSKSETPSSS